LIRRCDIHTSFSHLATVSDSFPPLQVYQVVRKILNDQVENPEFRLTVTVIYDSIKRSNSSLNRKPKRILEDSIERVVEVLKADVLEDETESIDGDFGGIEEQPAPVWYLLAHYLPC
jgi:ribosome biogenesis ATPase